MMTSPLQTAIQAFARDHQINLQSAEISSKVGQIEHDDYDALFAGIARLLPSIPESLHVPLYEVASQAFTEPEEFDGLREVCDRYLDKDSLAVHPGVSNDLVKVADDTAPSLSEDGSDGMEQGTDDELYNGFDPSSDYELNASAGNPFPLDTIDATLGKIPGESSSRWRVPENGAYTRPKSCHRSLLFHAGYFPFERQFGVPYFATEAPADSHRYYDDAPGNADVRNNTKSGVVDRRTLVEAYRSWRRRWAQRETALLKELVANRAGGARGDIKFADREECRKAAMDWAPEVWDSLAVQAGNRLSGRPGHALMCHYFNAGHDEWKDDEDLFLRNTACVNACLQDPEGGWDVIGTTMERPGIACLRRWQEINTTRKRIWSSDDDERLRKIVSAVGRHWSAASLLMGDRTGPQCMNRYVKQLTGKRVGKWSSEEVQKLQEAVADLGNDWTEISRRVGTRNDVQCREKWVCGLDPAVKHGPWSPTEDETLKEAVLNSAGGLWTQVAEKVDGRTDSQCRRRWSLLQQRPKAEVPKTPKRGRQKVGRWSREELERLRTAVRELGNAWDEIARRVGSREEGQCREKWDNLSKNGLTEADAATQSGSKAGRWSKEEVRLLNEAVEQVGESWGEVAKRVRSRDESQCWEKWVVLQHAPQERSWSQGEDEILRCRATGSENVDWEKLAKDLSREASACQRRWELVQHRLRRKRVAETGIGDLSAKRRKQGRWSIEETKLLKEGLEKHHLNFRAIAEMVKTRNEIQCREKWQSMMNTAAVDATWTAAEDDMLANAITENGLAWETVAESVASRSIQQCRRRWKVLKALGKSGHPGRWKSDEIMRFKQATQEVGEDWAEVARRVGTRNDWQCRERFGGGWKDADDQRLRQVVAEVGKKWRVVKQLMPGFSEVMCRRRWKELDGGGTVKGSDAVDGKQLKEENMKEDGEEVKQGVKQEDRV